MEKRVRLFVRSTLMLLMLGISAQVIGQPEVVTSIPSNSENFAAVGNLVYFNVGDELWRTDGTDAGTFFLKGGITISPKEIVLSNTEAVFENQATNDLWVTNGTREGTILLKAFDSNSIKFVGQSEGFLFFQAHEAATGVELYRTDNTPGGTVLIKDINPGPGDGFAGSGAMVWNDLFFAADDGTHGRELWKTDGLSSATMMVKDISPGAGNGFADRLTVLSHFDRFYFGGDTPDAGVEPWVSDGTAGGTYRLQDILPGEESPARLEFHIGHEGTVYFLAHLRDDFGTTELWRSGGTSESTSKIKDVGHDSEYHSFLVYQDKVSFFNHVDPYHHLWVTDGTAEGTQVIFSLHADNSVDYFDVVNDHLLFAGTDQGYPTPFYRSNGTRAGTESFAQFKSAHALPQRKNLTTVGEFAFYTDHDGPVDYGGYPINGADYFHLFQTDGFTTQSMRTKFGVSTLGADNVTDFNGKVLFTMQEQDAGGTSDHQLWIYDPDNASATQAFFTLVDADTDKDLQIINEGDLIKKSESSNINIRYNPVETPGSVVFSIDGVKVRTETAPPYSLAGDRSGDYNAWAGANPGSYTLTATPYSETGGKGIAGTPHTVSFTIQQAPSARCTASGTILREYWASVPGSRVSDIPVHTAPTHTSALSSLEGPTNAGTNYGSRIRGYICPPSTGDYIFWIASNDHSELWLSADEDPNNKVRIAYVEGATTPRQWTKFSSQKSAAISLTAGQRYYIEALHKQGAGTDNLSVGWQLPDGTMERPIPGSRLSPPEGQGEENLPPNINITYPWDNQAFNQPVTITIETDASDHEGDLVKVEFFEGSNKLAEVVSPPYDFTWENVPPGTYSLTAKATDGQGATDISQTVNITVNEGDGCTASGTITREYWANVPGSSVSDIPVDSRPTSTDELTMLEGPTNIGTNYGTRIRGYICPPVSSGYNFWISSNDHSELWLSTDDDPANKVLIGYVDRATGFREWNKYNTQGRTSFWLEAGKRYYIEVLHKQGAGTDHVSVGWQLPDGTLERPIPGSRLSPFEINTASDMHAAGTASGTENTISLEQNALYSRINIYPNPAPTGNAELRVSGYEGIDATIETQVEIINITGELVHVERIRCGGDCSTYPMNINQQLVPGVYMVKMKTNGIRFLQRLLVK